MTKKSGDFPGVVVLAAGMGKRMKSPLPKVLHEISGKPLLFHIIDRISEALPQAPLAVVVGHGRSQVESALRESPHYKGMAITFVDQPEQRGTGDAVRCAMGSNWGKALLKEGRSVLVLPGDQPLMQSSLIREMTKPLQGSAIRLLTRELSDPTGYGRILRKGGKVIKNVEERDASPREKAVREVGTSVYLFEPVFLSKSLGNLKPGNAQGELYLTDVIAMASKSKKKIDVLKWKDVDDLNGINDPWELAQAGRILNKRMVREWSLQGVRFVDPETTWLDSTVELEPEVIIEPGVTLQGKTRVGKGTRIESQVRLKDVRVGENVHLKQGTIAEASEIRSGAKVGPYAHLRPESIVGENSKIGNFVELKKARIGKDTSIAHLSYLGDAEVGNRVNIGCGFVTCNFDGRVIAGQRKHKTTIEDDVFVGSDCQTVAPVTLRKGSYVASGSTITEDVESDSLAIARSRQVNKAGYAKKLREK